VAPLQVNTPTIVVTVDAALAAAIVVLVVQAAEASTAAMVAAGAVAFLAVWGTLFPCSGMCSGRSATRRPGSRARRKAPDTSLVGERPRERWVRGAFRRPAAQVIVRRSGHHLGLGPGPLKQRTAVPTVRRLMGYGSQTKLPTGNCRTVLRS
jgi:hypothetical protein